MSQLTEILETQKQLVNGATISDKEKIKERWAEHFENVLNRDTVAGKDIDENEKICDTLDVKEDLFCEEELATILKGLKINKAPGAEYRYY